MIEIYVYLFKIHYYDFYYLRVLFKFLNSFYTEIASPDAISCELLSQSKLDLLVHLKINAVPLFSTEQRTSLELKS